jgi:hypothetical protein
MKRRLLWWRRMIAALAPLRSLKVVEGDMLPEKLPRWNLVVARDGDEDWSVGFWCPCGCGQRLLKRVKPRWDFRSIGEARCPCTRQFGCAKDANRISGCGRGRSSGVTNNCGSRYESIIAVWY